MIGVPAVGLETPIRRLQLKKAGALKEEASFLSLERGHAGKYKTLIVTRL